MSRYEEIKKKRTTYTKQEETTSGSRYQEIKENRGSLNYGVDANYLNAFFTDTKNFFDTSEADWNNRSWKSGTDESKNQTRTDTWQDLHSRAAIIRSWANATKGNMGDEAYGELISYLDGVTSGGGRVVQNFDDLGKYYSQWDTEDAWIKGGSENGEKRQQRYEANKKRIEELTAERNKLDPGIAHPAARAAVRNRYGSRLDEIDAEIKALETENAQYERGEGGWVNKTVDDHYDVTQREDFGITSANRNYTNPTREQIEIADVMNDSSTWKWDDANGVYRDAYGNELAVDDTNTYYNPKAQETQVVDKLGLYLNTSDDERVDAAMNTGGMREGIWTSVMREGYTGSWQYLTPTEMGIYYTYLGESQEKAYQYLEDMRLELNRRQTLDEIGQWYGDYEEAAFLEKIAMNVATFPAQLLSGVGGTVANVVDTLQGEEINPYSTAYSGMHYSQTVRGATAEDLTEIGSKIPVWKEINDFYSLGDVYQSGMSIGDSFLAIGIGGTAGGAILASSAAQSEAYRLYQQGASASQIAFGSTAAFAAELIFESVSIGELNKIKKMASPKTFGQFVKTVLVQGGVEASEEVFTEIANIVTNAFIMASQSDWAASVEENGGNIGKAFLDKTLDVLHAGISGFISGVGSGTVVGGGAYLGQRSQLARTGRTIMGAYGGVEALHDLAYQVADASNGKMAKTLKKQADNTSGEVATGKGLKKIGAAIKNNRNATRIGLLYDTVKTANNLANASANQADIAKSLQRKGFNAETANDLAAALVAQYNGQVLTNAQEKLLKSMKDSPEVMKVVHDIIANVQSTVGQRSQNIRDFQEAVETGHTLNAFARQIASKEFTPKGELTVSKDSKAHILETDEEIDIKGVAEIKDGKVLLDIGDGKTISVKEVSFASEDIALVYEAVANMGDKIDAETANKFIARYDGGNALAFAKGMTQAYQYGFYGYDRSEMAGKKTMSGVLSEKQRNYAYGLGEQYRQVKDQKDKENAHTGKAPAERGVFYRDKDGNDTDIGEYMKKAGSNLSKRQRTAIGVMRRFSEMMGVRFHVFETWTENGKTYYLNQDGKKTEGNPNGFYDQRTGEIYIALDAGAVSKNGFRDTMLFTIAHELTHYMKQWSPEHFTRISKIVFSQAGFKGNVAALVAKKMASRKNSISYETAVEEVVADAMETILKDGKVVQFMAEVKKQDHAAWQKLKSWFRKLEKFLLKLVDAYKDEQANTYEGRMVADFAEDTLRQIQRIWAEGAVAAGDRYQGVSTTEAKTVSAEATPAKAADTVDARDNFQAAQEQFSTDRIRGNADGAVPQSEVTTALTTAGDADTSEAAKVGQVEVLPNLEAVKNASASRATKAAPAEWAVDKHIASLISDVEPLKVLMAIHRENFNDPTFRAAFDKYLARFEAQWDSMPNNTKVARISGAFTAGTRALYEASKPKDGGVLKSERTEYEYLPKQMMNLTDGSGTILSLIEGLTGKKVKGLGGKDIIGYTGRDVRKYAMGISGFTQAQIKEVNKFMDAMSEFMGKAGVTYKFIGLQDVKDAKLHYTYNADGSIKSIVLSAMVKNGDYPVNFDLSSICKKREAMSKLMDKLAKRGSLDSGTVKLTPGNIFKINTALKDAGYETACLGCFVESKRYNSLEWATKFCNKWNAAVKKVNPNATFFGYGDATFNEDSFTLEQAIKVDEAATRYITATKTERLANALAKYRAKEQAGLPLVEGKILKVDGVELNTFSKAARKRLMDADISEELKTKYLTCDVSTLNIADVEFLLENGILPGAALSNKQAVTEMVKSGEAYQHLLRPSDLLTDRGISKLEALPNFHGVLYGHYGSGTPKLMQSYTPYNSEIALLPSHKGDQTLAEYLYKIAGVRMQSFSDFQIQNIFDYLQMVADLAARKLPAHAYTKEISFAKLLGMTGIKVNLSVMFDIDPMVDKAHAGLTKLNKLVHRGEYARVVLEDEQGKWVYNIGDYQTQRMFAEAFPDEAKRFLQSIGFADAVKLQTTPGYSANCGIIGVGYSDLGIFAMLDDNRIRYIIPYHASSLPAEIKLATNIALGTDYTPYQNNMKISGIVDRNGNAVNWSVKEAFKRLGSGQAVINELNEKIRTEGWVVKTTKAQNGHGSYGLYEDLMQTNDPRQTASNFMDWCCKNGTLPLFYQFASHQNYYKLLYDFNVYDCVTEEYAPQQAVTNTYPTMVDGQVQPGNVTDGGFDAEYFQGTVDKQMKFMNEYSRNRDADLEKLAENMEEGDYTLHSERDSDSYSIDTLSDFDYDGGKKGTEQEAKANGRREESRKDFDRRTSTEVLTKGQKGGLAYAYRPHLGTAISERAKAAEKELKKIGIPVFIYEKLETNRQGITTNHEKAGAAAIPGVGVFIPYNADTDSMEIAGHEGFHFFGNSVDRANYISVLVDHIDFASAEFIAYQTKYVQEMYFEEEVGTESEDFDLLTEEIFAYITGDIHSGDPRGEVHKFLRDYDVVKAAWDGLINKHATQKGQQYSSQETDADKNDIRYSERDTAPTFYSQMAKVVDGMKQEKFGAASVVSMLRGKGVKAEEIKWSGIEAWLEGKKSVTKAELQEFIAGSMLQIEESVLHGEDGKWRKYTLDGGENYREIVFTLPNSSYNNQMMRAHWGEDAEGVLAHARVQDFVVDGKKMLFIEEIQSDWHNEGHKSGDDTVPDAPFKDTYHEYVLKRLIRMAAEQGYDSIGWTTAVIQSERWSEDYAEGYRIEYDQDIPKFLRKYGKKWGATVGKTSIDTTNIDERDREMEALGYIDITRNYTEVWQMDVTDAMKESVMTEGQPLYQEREEDSVSDRALLAGALEELVRSPKERELIDQYQRNISKMEEVQERLRKLRAEIRNLTKAKGDKAKIKQMSETAKELADLIDRYDRELLKLQATKPLRDVLARARSAAYQKAKKSSEKALKEYQQQVSERFDRGVEGRRKTEMRKKIRKIIRDLDKILNRGDKKRNVKEDMKDFVAEALSAAEVLFTDNYTNEDLLRNGFGVELSEEEARYAKEAQDILEEIAALPFGNYEAMQARQEAEEKLRSKLAYRMSKLKEAFFRERQRLNKAEVSDVLGKLADAYAQLETSEYAYVNGAYHEAVYQYLKMLQEDVGGAKVKDMTLGQLQDLYKAYTMVLTTVRNANKMFAEGLTQSKEELARRVMSEVYQAGGEHGLWSKGQLARNQASWNNTKPIYAAERTGSATFVKLVMGLFKGQYKWATDMEEAKAFRQKVAEKYGFKSWDMEKTYKFTSSSGIEFELNLNQIMALYAYAKREQAHDHLLKGGFVFGKNTEVVVTKNGIKRTYLNKSAKAHNISDEIMDEIVSTLTEKQKGFVDEMQDYLSTTMGNKGNEVSMRLYGVKLFMEQFYFPLRSAGQFKEKAKEAELKQQQGQISIANSGFTHATTPKASNPVVLDGFTDVWASHVNEMSLYHSMVLPMEDFRRVYNYASPNMEGQESASVNSFIENAYGDAATGYFDQLYKELNGGAIVDPRENLSKKMIGRFKKSAVMLSNSVWVQQFSAIGRAYALIDPKHFIGAKVDKQKSAAAWEEMKQYAPVAIIKEMGGFDTHTGLSAKDYLLGEEYGKGERVKGFFKDKQYRDEIMGLLPAKADQLTWCAIWEAVKRETKAQNPGMDVKSEAFLKKAGERFSEVIEKTQVYDSVLARSANMRSKNGLMQMLTAFMAEPTTTVNMVEDALRKGNKKTIARTFGAVAASIILNNALVSVIYAMRDDDEDETFLEKYFQAFTSGMLDDINPMTYYPILKDIWSVFQGYDVERSDMAIYSDIADSVKKVVTLLANYDSDMDEDDAAKYHKQIGDALMSLLDAGAAAFGVPLKNARRDLMSYYNTFKTLTGGKSTTWNSFVDAIGGAALDTIPVVGWVAGKSKTDELYDAIVSGDTAYVERLRGGYKDETAYNIAVRKALRENDPRIHEAAVARMNGDLGTYTRIAKEIIAEGHFSQDYVVAAINAEINAIDKGESTTTSAPKASGLYKAEDFAVAISHGNAAMANAIKADIIKTAQQNGKTQEEAEKGFVSSATSACKELFLSGDISENQAIDALVTYCDKTEDEAMADVQYWAFKQDYPEVYADDQWFDTYYEKIADSGLPIDVYMDYRNTVSTITGEGKKEKRMAVINSLPITSAQKDALYFAEGWSESKLYEAPWH